MNFTLFELIALALEEDESEERRRRIERKKRRKRYSEGSIQPTSKPGIPVDHQTKDLVLNVYKYFVKETENFKTSRKSFNHIEEKVLEATGISKGTLSRILCEANQSEQRSTEPKQKRPKKESLENGKNKKEAQVSKTKNPNDHEFKDDKDNECGDAESENDEILTNNIQNTAVKSDFNINELELNTKEESLTDTCSETSNNISTLILKQEDEELLCEPVISVSYRPENDHDYDVYDRLEIKLEDNAAEET